LLNGFFIDSTPHINPRPNETALRERKKGDSRATVISFFKAKIVNGRVERKNNVKVKAKR
jgi:hypothetical protein